MSTLKTNLIEPSTGTALTMGEAGGNVIVGADSVKVNILQDAGDGYKYAAFTSTGAQTWTCPTGVTLAEILVVAGGSGGGGRYYGGGGGAGGVVWDTAYTVVPAVVYDLTVGAGGGGGGGGTPGTNGSDSTWNDNTEGSGVKFTAVGGGGGAGGDATDDAGDGGSGGGRNYSASQPAGVSTQQSAGTATGGTITSYGNDGGGNSDTQNGSGGGGAGAVGGGSAHPNGGGGGSGQLFSNFTAYGTDANNVFGSGGGYFGGGGGGAGGGHASLGGPGGVGGGGIGAGYNSDSPQIPGVAGTDNTGGGGGAGSHNSTISGQDGGSGIVVIRYQDPAPNAIFTSNGSGVLSGVNAGFGGPEVLVSTSSPDDVANVTFTLGDYEEYHFEFMEIKPVATGETPLMFQCSTDGSTFGPDLTTTVIRVFHNEADNNTEFDFNTSRAQQSATTFQRFDGGTGVGTAIGCAAGYLHLYNPSSTTHYKNFTMTSSDRQATSAFYTFELRNTGYWATTSALTHMRFQMQSGNIHSGTIKMYGIK